MQRLLPCLIHVCNIRNIEIGSLRTIHIGLLALAIPLDERVVGIVKDVAPTVEDDRLGTGNQRQACHLGLKDIIEAIAVGRDDIGQGIGELLHRLLMPDAHRLDGGIVDQSRRFPRRYRCRPYPSQKQFSQNGRSLP